MSKIKIAELFYSIQGEGRYMGVPSVFLRTFGCNFRCAGFGMPKGELSTEADELGSISHMFNKYEELPLVSTGCDSYASWHPDFKNLSPMLTSDAIVDRILEIIPFGEWREEHLVITGGEPLLGWQRAYIDLLNHPDLAERPDIAAKIAIWYWQTRVRPHINNFNDTRAVTQKINPAMRGLKDRHAKFMDYKNIL